MMCDQTKIPHRISYFKCVKMAKSMCSGTPWLWSGAGAVVRFVWSKGVGHIRVTAKETLEIQVLEMCFTITGLP